MKHFIIVISVALVLHIGITAANAQRSNEPAAPQVGYDLSWYTIDGGGAISTGGSYALGGSIGQPAVGVLSGGTYTLSGGFWSGTGSNYRIYLPMVLKNL
jgi:hypothetical protein